MDAALADTFSLRTGIIDSLAQQGGEFGATRSQLAMTMRFADGGIDFKQLPLLTPTMLHTATAAVAAPERERAPASVAPLPLPLPQAPIGFADSASQASRGSRHSRHSRRSRHSHRSHRSRRSRRSHRSVRKTPDLPPMSALRALHAADPREDGSLRPPRRPLGSDANVLAALSEVSDVSMTDDNELRSAEYMTRRELMKHITRDAAELGEALPKKVNENSSICLLQSWRDDLRTRVRGRQWAQQRLLIIKSGGRMIENSANMVKRYVGSLDGLTDTVVKDEAVLLDALTEMGAVRMGAAGEETPTDRFKNALLSGLFNYAIGPKLQDIMTSIGASETTAEHPFQSLTPAEFAQAGVPPMGFSDMNDLAPPPINADVFTSKQVPPPPPTAAGPAGDTSESDSDAEPGVSTVTRSMPRRPAPPPVAAPVAPPQHAAAAAHMAEYAERMRRSRAEAQAMEQHLRTMQAQAQQAQEQAEDAREALASTHLQQAHALQQLATLQAKRREAERPAREAPPPFVQRAMSVAPSQLPSNQMLAPERRDTPPPERCDTPLPPRSIRTADCETAELPTGAVDDSGDESDTVAEVVMVTEDGEGETSVVAAHSTGGLTSMLRENHSVDATWVEIMDAL